MTVAQALAYWEAFVRYEYRWFWVDIATKCGELYCCPDPWGARDVLQNAARALPRKSARELRKRLDELDALY
ncbi:hypothetical protein SK854_14620 [Lentzea sp. BCCO 10_0061]|uniref:Uncharacterized protein n=1 Tax=Lentzea sokolovensis TaxID=3095429 RepID=A0ABU4UX44_9PSEU|nr:hypothetical protein [Lentzea sp. BCCO 10_0061]MDX8143358.1 hypothetical protein [Lentzea sp. BCCO 10_0061]